jgi:menaquinol-cytochrome c reductase cytochrome b/c subunit
VNRAQQEYYKRDYAQAKAEGKPFFPYAVYKDLLIATLAIGLVIGLAIWHRVELGEPVNPASTDFVPRPEWYFFFLFELLKIFKGQNALMPVIMATFIVPNILMVLLIATPFIDRGPERRIQRRPIALFTGIAMIIFLAYMTNKGANSNEGVGAEGLPISGLDADADALAGSQLFLTNGCTACHNIAGVGAPGPGPNLTNEGSKGQKVEYYAGFLKDPPGNVMPNFTTFTPEQYKQLGTFLSGLGTKYK